MHIYICVYIYYACIHVCVCEHYALRFILMSTRFIISTNTTPQHQQHKYGIYKAVRATVWSLWHDLIKLGHDLTKLGHDLTKFGHDLTQLGHDLTKLGHKVRTTVRSQS